MFAVSNTYKSRECSDGSLHSRIGMRVIFLPVAVNVEYNTVSVYPRVERQCAHSIREIVLDNGTGIDTFFINTCFIMSNESQNFPTAAVISDRRATGGSDMATSPAYQHPVDNILPSALPVHVLCHDPYAWFSLRGQRLHSVNIDGFIYTVGSPSIDGLYHEAMQKRCRHLQSIDRHQQSKRVRCAARYRERYPDAVLPQWLAPSENFS